jgi:hypothetical protein
MLLPIRPQIIAFWKNNLGRGGADSLATGSIEQAIMRQTLNCHAAKSAL